MTNYLGDVTRGRERIAGRARISTDIPVAAEQLAEMYGGPIGARRWVEDLAAELRAAATPADLIASVSRITALADELAALPIGSDRARVIVLEIEAATTAAVAALLGVDR